MNQNLTTADGAQREITVRWPGRAGGSAIGVKNEKRPGRLAVPPNCRVPVRVAAFACFVLALYLVLAGIVAFANSELLGTQDSRVILMLVAILAWPLLLFAIPILVVLEVAVVISVLIIFHRERVSLGFLLLLNWHAMLFLLIRVA